MNRVAGAMTTAELRREQAFEAAKIIGRRFRNRRTGRVRMVTDVVRIHRRDAKVLKETETGPIFLGEKIRIVMDHTLYLSPRAFTDGWLTPAPPKTESTDG